MEISLNIDDIKKLLEQLFKVEFKIENEDNEHEPDDHFCPRFHFKGFYIDCPPEKLIKILNKEVEK